MVCPAGISRSKWGRMTRSFVYANSTFWNERAPFACHRSIGRVGSGTLSVSSSTPEIFSSAAAADW